MQKNETPVDDVAEREPYPSIEEGARRAEFLAGIEIALGEVRRGETIPIEEVLEEMKGWTHG